MSPRLAGDLFDPLPPSFDAAIANPPYRKISTDSPERHALRTVGVETSNLYTGFIALIQLFGTTACCSKTSSSMA
jgi:adenine-specific DNA-methyltransferase